MQPDADLTPSAVRRLRARCEADVVSWRRLLGGQTLHRPEPFLAERGGASPGEWAPDAAGAGTRVGFDGAGRPLIAIGVDDAERSVNQYFDHVEDRIRIISADREDRVLSVVEVIADASGRPLSAARSDGMVERYYHDDRGRVVEISTTRAGAGAGAAPTVVYSIDYASDGHPARVTFTSRYGSTAVWRDLSRAVEEERTTERELTDALADHLRSSIAEAVRQVADPVVAVLEGDGASTPPRGALLDRTYLESLREFPFAADDLGVRFLRDRGRHPGCRSLGDLTLVSAPTRRTLERMRRNAASDPRVRARISAALTAAVGLVAPSFAPLSLALQPQHDEASRQALAAACEIALDRASEERAVSSWRSTLETKAVELGLARIARAIATDARPGALLFAAVPGTVPGPPSPVPAFPPAATNGLIPVLRIGMGAIEAPRDQLVVFLAPGGHAVGAAPEERRWAVRWSSAVSAARLAIPAYEASFSVVPRGLASAASYFELSRRELVAYGELLQDPRWSTSRAEGMLLGRSHLRDESEEERLLLELRDPVVLRGAGSGRETLSVSVPRQELDPDDLLRFGQSSS